MTLIIPVTCLLLLPNSIWFMIFLGDMRVRGEERRSWLVRFLLLGPVAVAWYKSVRSLKDGEIRLGDRLYNMSMHFILPWTIHMLVLPGLIWGTTLVLDLIGGASSMMSTGEFILTGIFWLPVFYLISMAVVIPVWVVPAGAAAIILMVRKP